MLENAVYGTISFDCIGRDIRLSAAELDFTQNRVNKKRYVGMFYFLWVGQQGERHTDVYDIEKLLKSNPDALWDINDSEKAPRNMNYFFSEPLFGYYNMADPYILRKHIEMFIAADIDFIAFDYTNGLVYDKVWPQFFALLNEYRLAGYKVPQVTFLAKTNSRYVVTYMYENLYSKNLYPELWFYGPYDKPFIVAPKDTLAPEQLDFFYVRDPQWPNLERDNTAFPYVDWTRPQTVFENVMSVSVAQHTQGAFSFSEKLVNFAGNTENRGRGYSDVSGINRKEDINKCVNFIEQWEHAINVDPDIVFVTGWNEWTALKLVSDLDDSYPYWVDTFNVEFSRDIEMTKGYYDDNYYLQLIKQVRCYKGMCTLDNWSPNTTIDIGDCEKTEKRVISYPNISTKNYGRDFMGYIPKIHYSVPKPKNFIKEIKVAHDKDNLYFLINTEESISTKIESDINWMNVFIGVGKTQGTDSWESYNVLLNRRYAGSVEKFIDKKFHLIGKCECDIVNNHMRISIPLDMLNIHTENFSIRFKVADSVNLPDNIMDYYVSGCCVPIGRLSYLYGNI